MITSELIVIFEKLKKLPSEKLAIQKEILALGLRKDTVKTDIKNIHNKILKEVNSEIDENGKPKYSNAEKRQLEAESRIFNNESYQTLSSLLEDIEIKINQLSAEHEEIKDTIRVYDIISRIMGA